METKPYWQSKTLWANLVAITAILVQSRWGFVVDADQQLAFLGVINIVLRMVTRNAIGRWRRDTAEGAPDRGFARLRLLLALFMLSLLSLLLAGCMSMTNNIHLPPNAAGGSYDIKISMDKQTPVSVANPPISGNTATGLPGL